MTNNAFKYKIPVYIGLSRYTYDNDEKPELVVSSFDKNDAITKLYNEMIVLQNKIGFVIDKDGIEELSFKLGDYHFWIEERCIEV